VNFGGVKNIMGAFNQPRLVVCDLATFGTLSPREVRSGTAEIIKYGAVCSAELFEQLERGDLERLLSLNADVLVDVVAQCVTLKARVVEQDEPARGQLLLARHGRDDVRRQRDRIRSDALGGRDFGQTDLRAQPGVPEGADRPGELGGLLARQ